MKKLKLSYKTVMKKLMQCSHRLDIFCSKGSLVSLCLLRQPMGEYYARFVFRKKGFISYSFMKYYRLSHDVVTWDVNCDISTAYC